MNKSKENKPFNWLNFIDILDSSKIGLWSIEIDNNTGINRMYCNDIMIEILGASNHFTPEKYFEFWYSRIHKGYYSYVEKAIEQICSTNKSIEIQYPWKHPDFGDIIVRCSGKLISIKNGVITIKGYHQNINDLHQMKVVLSKTENEIFEWYQDSNTAYVHTNYSQLYKDESNIENFPQAWVDNGTVKEFFKDIYLETFDRIKNGSKKSVCELKMKNKNGEYTWFRMTLSKEKLTSDVSNVVIGTLENINNLKQMEISYVVESRFYKAILKEMVAYGEANITNNKFLVTGGIWREYNDILDSLTISEVLKKNMQKDILKEDQDKYIEVLNARNLLNAYNQGKNIIKCEFRRIVSKETVRWMELTVSLFQEPYKKHILGLFYIRDINSEKKEELILKYENISDNLTGLFKKGYINQEICINKKENIQKDYSSICELNERINRNILAITSYLRKCYSYEENMDFILQTITAFYKSEFGFIFKIGRNDDIQIHSITNTSLSNELKIEIENIIRNEIISAPINCIKYIDCEQDAISISYSLYNLIIKYRLQNMIIIPIINKDEYLGYSVCINNINIKDNIYYNKIEEYSQNIAYFICQEIIKNTLKIDLHFEKNYDNLTGLLNRNAYRSYERAYDVDNVNTIGVLCLALNELNNINHTAGILAGDQILLDLSNILKNQFHHKLIFRLNGNEFLIIMKNIKYEVFLEKIDILIKSLEKIGLSITYGKTWSSDEKELNHIVNSAIYFRKMENQKNKQLINNENLYKRNTLFSELMLSIESKEYEIFLQPKFYLNDDSLAGAEALIRKRNSENGYVSPDKFIPILEHNYLIHYIDLFVFEEVLKLLKSLKKKGKKLIPISLNFSRRTLLEDDIIRQVIEIKDKYDIDLSYVELEVTESIGDLEKQAICTVLKELESIGINILLDDFGVKYSNLTILSEITFDGLKLDKSMVKNLGINSTNEIIMKNIISMCKDLNVKTTAEGIETVEQKDILKSMNCDIVQGYLYSKPLPVSEFLEKYCI